MNAVTFLLGYAMALSWLAPVNGVMNVWVAPVAEPAKARAVTDDAAVAEVKRILLVHEKAVHALREQLVPQCTMITPNLPEAGVLLDARPVETVKEMRQAAERLRRLIDWLVAEARSSAAGI